MEIKGEHLLFLLGAGASFDAGIPISSKMVERVEQLFETEEWKPYKDLYHYLKASINYSDGILGNFNETFNIERLLIVISEIEKRDRNIMYPFIGTWNSRLIDLAGAGFENITKFQKLIRKQLNEWVRVKNYDDAGYYEAFSSLSADIAQLMKVFTLNYDLCFERIVGKDKVIETGFSKNTKEWHYSNFDEASAKHFFLYKLHGSIDWYVNEKASTKLSISDDPVEKPELIFGIEHKMTSIDPYFYYSSKLREACLNEARLIVVIGYSFADEYVNNILTQALKAKNYLRILSVSPISNEDKERGRIGNLLGMQNFDQIFIKSEKAKDFMTNTMNKDYFGELIKEPEDVPF